MFEIGEIAMMRDFARRLAARSVLALAMAGVVFCCGACAKKGPGADTPKRTDAQIEQNKAEMKSKMMDMMNQQKKGGPTGPDAGSAPAGE